MTKLVHITQGEPCCDLVEQAGDILKAGGVTIFPTDSVYGIACAALPNNQGHRRIFALKQRDPSLTLPLLISSAEELELWAGSINTAARTLAQAFWPGALTLIVEASEALPQEYVRPNNTVALRVPAYKLVCDIAEYVGVPLATTSANIHGMPSPTNANELDKALLKGVDLTLDGGSTSLGLASTIVDVTQELPKIVRTGAISASHIMEVLSSAQ